MDPLFNGILRRMPEIYLRAFYAITNRYFRLFVYINLDLKRSLSCRAEPFTPWHLMKKNLMEKNLTKQKV